MNKVFITFLILFIAFSACRKDFIPHNATDRNPIPLAERTCIELPLPKDAKFVPASRTIPSVATPLIAKGWVIDYAAWTQVFHSDSSQLYAYLRANAATVSYVQRRANISTVVSYLQIFTTPDTLKGDIIAFSSYCAQNLSGKVPADGFTLLSYTYHLNGGGGISWVGGLATTNYNACVCGIEGTTSWTWQGFTIPSLKYSWDGQVIAHEEGHLFFGLQHTHDGDSTWQKVKLDDCGGYAGYNEGCQSKEPNLQGCDVPLDSILCNKNLQCTLPLFPDSGLIMSYCHIAQYAGRAVGISLVKGYGSFDSTKAVNYILANEQYLYFIKRNSIKQQSVKAFIY